MLDDIQLALANADVPTELIDGMTRRLRARLISSDFQKYTRKQSVIRRWVQQELEKLLEPGVTAYKPRKGRVNVLMFVGLQGAGKTTTVAKVAHYFKRRKWRCALICCDTFRAGAFDQLKQNATKIGVPFYGSYLESDPVRLAVDGVRAFREEGFDLILVDTSGRHKQEKHLFREMKQLEAAIRPDDIVFVMDGTIGQMAMSQAEAFKNMVEVGSCIIIKLDGGNLRGGGAVAAVAATHAPITFVGYGEHFRDLEEFDAHGYASRLLGMSDPRGLARKMRGCDLAVGPEVVERMMQGAFTLRDLHDQLTVIMKMGSVSEVVAFVAPQMLGSLKGHEDGSFRKYLTIMDSMTDEELDTPEFGTLSLDTRRIRRLALGSGCGEGAVLDMLAICKKFRGMLGRASKKVRGLARMRHRFVPPGYDS